MRRLLAALGLARKAGDLVTGFEQTQTAIEANRAAFVIEALDGAADGRRKLANARRRTSASARLVGLFTSSELGLALGAENVVHSAFLAGRGAERWSVEADRLAGFRPLCPEGWDF
jgi:ribosomal protein L7Ae-like RNA K-turn-binding protein